MLQKFLLKNICTSVHIAKWISSLPVLMLALRGILQNTQNVCYDLKFIVTILKLFEIETEINIW